MRLDKNFFRVQGAWPAGSPLDKAQTKQCTRRSVKTLIWKHFSRYSPTKQFACRVRSLGKNPVKAPILNPRDIMRMGPGPGRLHQRPITPIRAAIREISGVDVLTCTCHSTVRTRGSICDLTCTGFQPFLELHPVSGLGGDGWDKESPNLLRCR